MSEKKLKSKSNHRLGLWVGSNQTIGILRGIRAQVHIGIPLEDREQIAQGQGNECLLSAGQEA